MLSNIGPIDIFFISPFPAADVYSNIYIFIATKYMIICDIYHVFNTTANVHFEDDLQMVISWLVEGLTICIWWLFNLPNNLCIRMQNMFSTGNHSDHVQIIN